MFSISEPTQNKRDLAEYQCSADCPFWVYSNRALFLLLRLATHAQPETGFNTFEDTGRYGVLAVGIKAPLASLLLAQFG